MSPLTFDELLAQSEARRADRRRFEPAERFYAPRRVQPDWFCTCAMCLEKRQMEA